MTNDDAAGNVVFVVMDTVRKSHLSVYGYDRPTTPGLERFAEEAAVFEQAVSPAPWTLPVHASLFTGMYPSEHGASQENPYLEGATTLAETLSGAGYDTACYSSNAWITPYTHLTDGFDDQDNFFEVMPGDFLSGPLAKAWKTMNDSESLRKVADYLVSVGNKIHEYTASGEGADSKTPQVIDRTMEFIDDADDGYFAFVNLMDAHLPYHPPEEYKQEFAPGVDSTKVCQNSKEYNCGARDIDDDEWEAIEGLYDAEIRHIDAELQRLFSWLKDNGEWEDTMVVVCADHGELHGEHGLYGHEFCIYDPLVNVPLLVKHPEMETGRREDQQVELVDLYHTVLDHAGVEARESSAVAALGGLSGVCGERGAERLGKVARESPGRRGLRLRGILPTGGRTQAARTEGRGRRHRTGRELPVLLPDAGRTPPRRQVRPQRAHHRRVLPPRRRPGRDRRLARRGQ